MFRHSKQPGFSLIPAGRARRAAALAGWALLLGACGLSGADVTTYRDDQQRSLFELPDDWNLYGAEEVSRLEEVPLIPDMGGYQPISYVAFDGAAGRNLGNLTLEINESPFPVGAQIIRQISPADKDMLSRQLLTLSAFDLSEPGLGVQAIQSEDFSFGRDFDGVRRLLGITDGEGQLQGAIYILAVTNPDATHLYSMAAGCSLACFQERQTEISRAVDSWIVNTRQ